MKSLYLRVAAKIVENISFRLFRMVPRTMKSISTTCFALGLFVVDLVAGCQHMLDLVWHGHCLARGVRFGAARCSWFRGDCCLSLCTCVSQFFELCRLVGLLLWLLIFVFWCLAIPRLPGKWLMLFLGSMQPTHDRAGPVLAV